VNSNLAGAVPTVSWLQVAESEAREKAEVAGCPFWAIRAAYIWAESGLVNACKLLCTCYGMAALTIARYFKMVVSAHPFRGIDVGSPHDREREVAGESAEDIHRVKET
jgi:hypothetical protein